jgi:hypothetical protein
MLDHGQKGMKGEAYSILGRLRSSDIKDSLTLFRLAVEPGVGQLTLGVILEVPSVQHGGPGPL